MIHMSKYLTTKSGGSAPELFTSLIGTFQESDIGFAAIVGSAVFNVLFVIGVCAFVAPKPLELTWWPLYRDCSYYATGLVVLAIFFIVTTENEIYWYEALVLFILYVGYIILMKYNQKIHQKITDWRSKRDRKETFKITLDRRSTLAALEELDETLDRDILHNVCVDEKDRHKTTFRAGMMNILLNDDWDWNDTASITVVSAIAGDVKETFDKVLYCFDGCHLDWRFLDFTQLDADHNGFLDINELEPVLQDLNADMTRSSIPDLMKLKLLIPPLICHCIQCTEG